jgi:hypothetical protein
LIHKEEAMKILNTKRQSSAKVEIGDQAFSSLRSAMSELEKTINSWKFVLPPMLMLSGLWAKAKADIEAEEDAKIFALLDAAAQPIKEG